MRGTFLPLALALGAGCLAFSSCGFTDSSSRYSTRERQVEARTEGDVELRFGFDGNLLVVVAPLHAAAGRSEFSRARLDAQTHPDGPRLWLSVSLWNFDPPAAPAGTAAASEPAAPSPWHDGLPLTAMLPGPASGKVASLAPSKLLAAGAASGVKPLLETLMGAGAIAPPKGGQSLHLVAALPTAAVLGDLVDVQVELAPKQVALAPAVVPALLWDEFRSQPSRARFDALIQAKARAAATVPAAPGAKEAERDERDPGK